MAVDEMGMRKREEAATAKSVESDSKTSHTG